MGDGCACARTQTKKKNSSKQDSFIYVSGIVIYLKVSYAYLFLIATGGWEQKIFFRI